MSLANATVINDFSELGFNWALMAPVMVVLFGAIIGILLEAFVSAKHRWSVQCAWSIAVVAIALLTFAPSFGAFDLQSGQRLVRGELIVDGFSMFSQMLMLIVGLLALLPMVDRTGSRVSAFAGQPSDIPGSFQEEQTERRGYQRSEVLPLSLFSLGGMMLFPMANSMLTLFVALEIISLPLYAMTAMARYRRLLSQEAALKYYVLGAFASGFMLMGISLLYGYSGSLLLDQLALAIPYRVASPALLMTGAALMMVGLLFKIGAAPFHAWTPDVYQGAPTPVTGFMAAGVKAAAFLAMLRFFSTVVVQFEANFKPFLWTVAILTMAVGTFFGLVQDNIKRMLAYSSIAHAGFILIAFTKGALNANGAVLFYLLTYGVATIGAFAIIYLVRVTNEDGIATAEQHSMPAWAGFGKTHPVLAGCMMLFLLSFAGIPLTAGFMGKFMAFSAGVQGGATALVICAVIASAITAFYYFRLGKIMFLDPVAENTTVAPHAEITYVAIGICALLTVLLGIFPGSVLDILQNTAIVIP